MRGYIELLIVYLVLKFSKFFLEVILKIVLGGKFWLKF